MEYLAVLGVFTAIMPQVLITMCAMAAAFHGVLGHRKAPRRVLVYGICLACYLLPVSLGLLLLNEAIDAFRFAWAVAISVATPSATAMMAYSFGKEIYDDQQILARLDEWESIELP